MLSNLYQRFMGTPWVYDRLRPWLFGGWNFTPVYNWLEIEPHDVILDVGCGTGATMTHIRGFAHYHGFDIDPRALDAFKEKYPANNIHLYPKPVSPADVCAVRPTKVVLMGLLHHLSDAEVEELFSALARGDSIRRLITLDPERIHGDLINNVVIGLDRGKFVRTHEHYVRLVSKYFPIRETARLTTGNKAAKFFAMCINGPAREWNRNAA